MTVLHHIVVGGEVCQELSENYTGCGRAAPVPWPAHSPDLNPLNSYYVAIFENQDLCHYHQY